MPEIKRKIPFDIVIDTREQEPFFFRAYNVTTQWAGLHTGDYSIAGMEDRITVERKSLGDLAGCMTVGRERFERELERMKDFQSAIVVVESPLTMLQRGNYRCHLNPASFEQSILAMMIRYRVPFLFGRNREYAEWLVFNCLRHFYNSDLPQSKKVPYIPPPRQ